MIWGDLLHHQNPPEISNPSVNLWQSQGTIIILQIANVTSFHCCQNEVHRDMLSHWFREPKHGYCYSIKTQRACLWDHVRSATWFYQPISEVTITNGVIECLKCSHSQHVQYSSDLKPQIKVLHTSKVAVLHIVHSQVAKQCLLTNGSYVMTYSDFWTAIDAVIWWI